MSRDVSPNLLVVLVTPLRLVRARVHPPHCRTCEQASAAQGRLARKVRGRQPPVDIESCK